MTGAQQWPERRDLSGGSQQIAVRGLAAVATRYWWVLALRGALLVGLGIAMLAWPHATLMVFVAIFAAYLFLDGLTGIGQGFVERRSGRPAFWWFAQGALAIAFAVIVLAWPRGVATVFVWIIAIWAVLAALAGVVAGLRLRRQRRSGWLLMLTVGALFGLFGISLMTNPSAGILGLLWVVAVWAIVSGVVFIGAGFVVRRVGREVLAADGFQSH